jgi:hypothetical protein
MLITPLTQRDDRRTRVTVTAPSIEERKAEVRRVLLSPQFRRTPKLQRFLELICDYYFQNRAHEINEFLIATEAFGKGPAFDPSQDSLVRVQAREVRRRLREHYQTDGKESRIILDIPLGHYVPGFTVVENQEPQKQSRSFKASWIMLGVTALVCILTLFFTDRERRQLLGASAMAAARSAPALTPLLSRFWTRFLESDVPTLLVLSNPDVGACKPSRPAADGTSPRMIASDGSPCPDEYTGMGEAVALHLVTNLFKSAKQTLIVKQSRMVNADDIKRYNLILLGGKSVNAWTRRLGDDLSLEQSQTDVGQRYATVFDQKTSELIRDRAIIALRKHASTGHWLLFLYGKHSQGTQAAAEASSDERFLSQLKWPPPAAPFPDSFRILVGVNVNDGIPQDPIPAAVRVP